jgi:hypothetical protein
VTDAEREAADAARALLGRPWREFDRHFPAEWAYTCAAGVCFYGMKDPEPRLLPEPVRRAWSARADLQQMFPAPHDLSTAPNLVSWLAESGRGQHPEVDDWFRRHPLIAAASLDPAGPAAAIPPAPPVPAPPGVSAALPPRRPVWRRAVGRARRTLLGQP